MPEVVKPQEMITPYRPAVPAVGQVSNVPHPGLPSLAPAPAAPPVQDPLADIRAEAARPAEEDDDERGFLMNWLLDWMEDAPYWLGSAVLHLVVFVLLSFGFSSVAEDTSPDALAVAGRGDEGVDSIDDPEPTFEAIGPFDLLYRPVAKDEQTDEPQEQPPVKNPPPDAPKDKSPRNGLPDVAFVEPLTEGSLPLLTRGAITPSPPHLDGPGLRLEFTGIGSVPGFASDVMAPLKDVPMTAGVLGGRGDAARGGLVVAAGGSPGSERAVAAALVWLAEHQLADGGWSFNHTQASSCKGQCRNAGGAADARNAATAMALLPFLGAGQTHKSGKYTDTVERGLNYLLSHMKDGPEGVPRVWDRRHKGQKLKDKARGSTFFESTGRMYAHGLASIAMCEAYAMTHDKDLRDPAQEAIDFICFAQDPQGGGWRYRPQERGDTSMVGWQLMALKSGNMAYLTVPEATMAKAMKYLDQVQTSDGANYGYQGPEAREATTAIGLLCRMYLGWKKDHPGLLKGVEWLSARGPSQDNMYYNYYATQVMRHWEGEPWRRWNLVMREQLIDTQAKTGHETGSWFMPGSDHGTGPGGRLYFTALAAMTLEIYYRFLPLYRTQSVEDRVKGKEE
jgi:hypothetical protein